MTEVEAPHAQAEQPRLQQAEVPAAPAVAKVPAVKKNSVGNFDKMNPDVVPPAELLKEG